MNWKQVQLGDTAQYRADKVESEKLNSNNFISTENMIPDKGGITESSYPPSTNKVSAYFENDVLVSNIRPYFKKIWFADKFGGCSNDLIVFKPLSDTIFPKFLFYQLSKDEFFNYMMSGVSGTKMPRGNKKAIPKFQFLLPSLPTQHKIASILSAYDDLIENNLKRIKLLEEAAQNIFKEWFVQFRFPGHENVKFSEEGLPKGWDRKSLSKLCNSIEDGDWIESKDQNGSDYRLIQVSNIGVNSFVETNKWRWITEDTFNNLRCREIEDGDILVSRMPNGIGRSWLAEKMDFRMVTVVDVAIVKPNLKLTSKYYLNEKFNSIENIQLCESLAGGTTRKRISKKTLASIAHLNPDKKILNNFDELISSIYFLKSKLFKQNQILKEARDILLPRFMDRRIEV